MKELIGTAILMISLLGVGNRAFAEFHSAVRKAALTQVSRGLPSLTQLTHALRGQIKNKQATVRQPVHVSLDLKFRGRLEN